MPSLLSSLNTMRLDGHQVNGWMAHFPGTLVCTFTVSSSPLYPFISTVSTTVAVTVTSGSAANVYPGFRVAVEDQFGNSKGTIEVSYAGTISATTLPLREHDKGELELVINDVLKVYSVVPIRPKIVNETENFQPDNVAYSDQYTNSRPIACSGGHKAVFVDDGQTYATIATKGSNSFLTRAASSTLLHHWYYPTGVALKIGSTDTDADPIFEVNVGHYTVRHVVEDDDTGVTTTQFIQYAVFDTATTPFECLVENLSGTEENGWSATVRVLSDAGLTTLPDGSWVTLFVQEYAGGTMQSFGNEFSDRSTIKLTGILIRDTSTGNAENDELRFDVVSPLAYFTEQTSYSKVMLRVDGSGWSDTPNLTVKLAMCYLWLYYSTVGESGVDLIFNITDYDYPGIYLNRSTLKGQLDELADGTDARVVCTRDGHIRIHTRPQYIAYSDRVNYPVTPLTTDDMLEYSFTRTHNNRAEMVECRGFIEGTSFDPVSGTTQPIFSRYPGDSVMVGTQNTVYERLFAASQTDLNDRCGRRGAWVIGDYIYGRTKIRVPDELVLVMRTGAYDAFDFYQDYITFTMYAADNLREFDLSVLTFFVSAVNVEYSEGTARVRLTLKCATHAPAGATHTYPSDDGSVPPITFPTYPTYPVIPVPAGYLSASPGNMALMCASKRATGDFSIPGSAGGPTWSAATWASLGVSGTFKQWTVDGFASPAAGWVTTTTTIYYGTVTAGTYTSKHTFATSSIHVSTDASFAESGWMMAVQFLPGVGTKATYTTNNGTSWNTVTVTAHYPTDYNASLHDIIPGCVITSKTAGVAYCTAYDSTAVIASITSALYKTTDYGATWTKITSPSVASSLTLGQSIHIPYGGSESTLFLTRMVGLGDAQFLRAVGTTVTVITPAVSAVEYAPEHYSRDLISTSIQQPRRMILVAQSETTANYIALKTEDSLATSVTYTVIAAAGTSIRHCAISGNNPNVHYWWGSDYIAYSNNNSASLDNRTGNLASLSAGEIIAIAGY